MSGDTSRTTVPAALVIDRQRCCSAQYVASIAFQMTRNVETQPRRRSSKPESPVQHSQSQEPRALSASAICRAAIKPP